VTRTSLGPLKTITFIVIVVIPFLKIFSFVVVRFIGRLANIIVATALTSSPFSLSSPPCASLLVLVMMGSGGASFGLVPWIVLLFLVFCRFLEK
jgi:hypothetical protein